MLRCASSFVVAACSGDTFRSLWASGTCPRRLTPQLSRALPAAFLRSRPQFKAFYDFLQVRQPRPGCGGGADGDGRELAGLVTIAADDAVGQVYLVRLLLGALDHLVRAFPTTSAASVAGIRDDFVVEHPLADAGRTELVEYMGLVFLPELAHGGDDRVHAALS